MSLWFTCYFLPSRRKLKIFCRIKQWLVFCCHQLKIQKRGIFDILMTVTLGVNMITTQIDNMITTTIWAVYFIFIFQDLQNSVPLFLFRLSFSRFSYSGKMRRGRGCQFNIVNKYGQKILQPRNFKTKLIILHKITGRPTCYFVSPTFV